MMGGNLCTTVLIPINSSFSKGSTCNGVKGDGLEFQVHNSIVNIRTTVLIPPPAGTPFGKGRNIIKSKIMKIPDIIKEASRELRKNMTESEIILWSFIKSGKLGANFLRQKPIYVFTEDNGLDRYIIPDFYCFEKKLILEIDGSIHNLKEVYELDTYKESLLKNLGFTILRIKNEDIKNNINHIIKTIKQHI